jgi:hypothetical protein
MRRIAYLLVIALLALSSCEKMIMPETKSKKPTAIFQELWQTLDEGYSLFNQKKIRWDSAYILFKPLIYDTMTERQLFDTCAKMLRLRLNDPQVVLDAGFAETHKDDRYKYPLNFNKALLERYYWKDAQKTGPLIHTIIDSIGYVYYGSFNDDVSDEDIVAVIERFREQAITKGTVIDIRGNKGGKIDNVFRLLSRIDIPDELLNTTTLIYQAAYKNGPKHDQFTKVQDNWLKENEQDKFYGNVVVLTNRDNMNVATLFASGARSFANVKVLGDTTMGYSGIPAGYELANGWTIHYPNTLMFNSEGTSMVNGVPPTHPVSMKAADEAQGKDSILEEALKELEEE